MTKLLRRIAFFILVLVHFSFLLAIFFERINTPLIIGFLLFISALITHAYFNAPRDEEAHFIEDLYVILYVVTGALSTYYLSVEFKLGPVIAAGLIGTIASFIPEFNKRNEFLRELPASIYCGAFVGMTAPAVAEDFRFIIFAAFMTGAFLILSKNIFNGFGGKLGTIAFGGVAFTSLLLYLFF
ncbi:hypothetical protein L1I30_13780 [Gillisia sp. M10.2A]|uniref:Phosphatidate cytidylyltransferase n=1 Tax=Gillisia lutea TaxID=2909668 RepID=A0ABS9EIR2_9FLAO|nr:hypothetical protein [Gillisia lutea]MCF4102743.1 hypothetical protein [Gillisia lutea]